ncbi:putative DeoR family transcriptional regulator [Streptomyces viridochromogenes Tue57]|uniref:Putative DeoR family transcriptional regulator n=1 Tax=Streptomyces viridochromogenes Tue57 TaxID=1160705 RepID=L8PF83_STRVR|nr:putative DeoR family transcriptional regulator [Streptomyces viridochromogenes Tue57]
MPQPRRQHLLQLRQRPHRRLLHALDRVPRPGPQPDRDRHGLLVVQDERRHRLARDKPVPAVRPHRRLYGIPQLPQPVDVPPDRTPGHPEPLGELTAGPFAGRLQEGEERQKPCRSIRRHESEHAADLGQDLT